MKPLNEERGEPEAGVPQEGRNSDRRLRVLFCGTPEFALASLNHIVDSRHGVVGVVTVPDRPQGRGRKPAPSPVKSRALELDVPLGQPESLDEPRFLEWVSALNPDLIAVVAFRILPEVLYNRVPMGAVNLHASLLPAYRGAAPIARALMDGKEETGVTTFQIARKVDTGGILLQTRVQITPSDNAGTLSERLAKTGAALLVQTLDGLAAGTLHPSPQDPALVTRAPKLTAEDRPIRWTEPAAVSHHRVRALAPRPGATFRRAEKVLKVLETDYDPSPTPEPPGSVRQESDGDALAVATGEGTLLIRKLQPPGKPAMTADAYLRGNPVEPGEHLE